MMGFIFRNDIKKKNISGKTENAAYEHFQTFPTMFSNDHFHRNSMYTYLVCIVALW